MRRPASPSCFRGSPRKGQLLLAACLTAAALPAWAEAPRCDAATCPPLQLRLEEGFEVSRERIGQGLPAAAPVPARPSEALQPAPAPTPAAPLSPWLAAVLALAAGMLLQGALQGLLRRRRMAAAAAVEPAVAAAPIPARAVGLEPDVPETTPAVALDVEAPSLEPVAAGMALTEAQPDLVEEPLAAPVRFELEPLDVETPAELTEPQVLALAGEVLAEPEVSEIASDALAEPEAPELPGAAGAIAEVPPDFMLEPEFLVEAGEEPVPPIQLEEEASVEAVAEATVEASTPDDALAALAETETPGLSSEAWAAAEAPPDLVLEPEFLVEAVAEATVEASAPDDTLAALLEPETPERPGEAWAASEASPDFELEPEFLVVASEEPAPPVQPEEEASVEAVAEAPAVESAADDAFGAIVDEVAGIEPFVDAMLPEPAPVEAAVRPAPAIASDTHHLETVALLRRLSAQRARGLHPEERLASVFRRISSGRTEAADRSLRELEAFCSEDEEAFPPELMTTRQHIVRGRDYELGQRIDGLRARAQDEASGRRLAVARAFLQRQRFDAAAEVLDELESDLGGEVEIA